MTEVSVKESLIDPVNETSVTVIVSNAPIVYLKNAHADRVNAKFARCLTQKGPPMKTVADVNVVRAIVLVASLFDYLLVRMMRLQTRRAVAFVTAKPA